MNIAEFLLELITITGCSAVNIAYGPFFCLPEKTIQRKRFGGEYGKLTRMLALKLRTRTRKVLSEG